MNSPHFLVVVPTNKANRPDVGACTWTRGALRALRPLNLLVKVWKNIDFGLYIIFRCALTWWITYIAGNGYIFSLLNCGYSWTARLLSLYNCFSFSFHSISSIGVSTAFWQYISCEMRRRTQYFCWSESVRHVAAGNQRHEGLRPATWSSNNFFVEQTTRTIQLPDSEKQDSSYVVPYKILIPLSLHCLAVHLRVD